MNAPAVPPLVPPIVECDQIHAGMAVADLADAIEFYTNRLGFRKDFTYGEPPNFAGMSLGNVQIFLENGTPTPNDDAPAAFFIVGNVDELYEFHVASGVQLACDIGDRPYGIRDYCVRDLNGYTLAFGQHLMDQGPPIPVERVDVTARLEKRLAALLQDLAEHKRMTVGQCLEEMLLHTNDGVGPHTKATLRYIEKLKKKHGIDYDSHGSYRFVEGQ